MYAHPSHTLIRTHTAPEHRGDSLFRAGWVQQCLQCVSKVTWTCAASLCAGWPGLLPHWEVLEVHGQQMVHIHISSCNPDACWYSDNNVISQPSLCAVFQQTFPGISTGDHLSLLKADSRFEWVHPWSSKIPAKFRKLPEYTIVNLSDLIFYILVMFVHTL